MTQAWEYLVTNQESLTDLSRLGWELVAVVPTENGLPGCYLKRPATSFRERVTEEQKRRFYAARGLAEPVEMGR